MISAALATLNTDAERNELSKFYRENKDRFYAIAFSRLHNRELSEDALQEAFLNIVKYPKTFFALETHKKVSYALLIIKNVISRMQKKSEKHIIEELTDDAANDTISVEEIVIGDISAEKIKEFINGLPEARKQALNLKTVYGLSNAQIADILGISEAATRKRISDAYKLIKDFINRSLNYE